MLSLWVTDENVPNQTIQDDEQIHKRHKENPQKRAIVGLSKFSQKDKPTRRIKWMNAFLQA